MAHAGVHVGPTALLAWLLAVSLVVLWVGRAPTPGQVRGLTAVAVGGLTFQGLHFVEHIAQFGYWCLHPSEAPWLTPWAAAGRDMLANVDGSGVTGNEFLHLLGNLIFLVAIVALWLLAVHHEEPIAERGPLRIGLWVQGYHVVEHVALTATWLAFGKAIAVSTGFGLLPAGPVLSTTRVWAHFALNLVATAYAFVAAVRLRRHLVSHPAVRLASA